MHKRLYIGNLTTPGITKLTDFPPLDTSLRLAIRTPHQDELLLIQLFQYYIKSYRNAEFAVSIANMLKIQSYRTEI